MFYSVRSERLLMEELNYNLLLRWFVGLSGDDVVWDVTVFTKNRQRLWQGQIAESSCRCGAATFASDEHFTVDGTRIEAWTNRRSFREKPDPPEPGTGSGGRVTLRDTQESSTDPEARLYKRRAAGDALRSYLAHVLMENRNGLIEQPRVTEARTREERKPHWRCCSSGCSGGTARNEKRAP